MMVMLIKLLLQHIMLKVLQMVQNVHHFIMIKLKIVSIAHKVIIIIMIRMHAKDVKLA